MRTRGRSGSDSELADSGVVSCRRGPRSPANPIEPRSGPVPPSPETCTPSGASAIAVAVTEASGPKGAGVRTSSPGLAVVTSLRVQQDAFTFGLRRFGQGCEREGEAVDADAGRAPLGFEVPFGLPWRVGPREGRPGIQSNRVRLRTGQEASLTVVSPLARSRRTEFQERGVPRRPPCRQRELDVEQLALERTRREAVYLQSAEVGGQTPLELGLGSLIAARKLTRAGQRDPAEVEQVAQLT